MCGVSRSVTLQDNKLSSVSLRKVSSPLTRGRLAIALTIASQQHAWPWCFLHSLVGLLRLTSSSWRARWTHIALATYRHLSPSPKPTTWSPNSRLRTNTSLNLRKHAHVGADGRKPPHEMDIRNLNPKNIELHVHMSTTTTHNISICHLEQYVESLYCKTRSNIASFKTCNNLTRQKLGWCNLWWGLKTNVMDNGFLVFKRVVRVVHAIEVGGGHWRGWDDMAMKVRRNGVRNGNNVATKVVNSKQKHTPQGNAK